MVVVFLMLGLANVMGSLFVGLELIVIGCYGGCVHYIISLYFRNGLCVAWWDLV